MKSLISTHDNLGKSVGVSLTILFLLMGSSATSLQIKSPLLLASSSVVGTPLRPSQSYQNVTTDTLTFADQNPTTAGQFGYSVAISGNIAVVGAPGEGAGNAYVLNITSGKLLFRLSDPILPQQGEEFGYSVAIEIPPPGGGDGVVVVGAPDYKTTSIREDAGNVYLFDAKTGSYTGSLTDQHSQADGYFGNSVAISSNSTKGLIVVGAPGESHVVNKPSIGEAYTYSIAGKYNTTLKNPDPATSGAFGESVAESPSGNSIVVGAPGTSFGGLYSSGAASLYDGSTKYLNMITDPWGTACECSAFFGFSVAASNTIVVVGAWGDGNTVNLYSNPTPEAGVAYIFNQTAKSGLLIGTLIDPSPVVGGEFGRAVAANGNYIVVGAPGDDVSGVAAGDAYVFNSTAPFAQAFKVLSSPKPVASGSFGASAAVSAGTQNSSLPIFVFGAPQPESSGNAYAFFPILTPIIFLPGFAGTVLDNNGVQVWPQPASGTVASLELASDGTSPLNPGTDITTDGVILNVPVNAFGITITTVDFYGQMVSYLENLGYQMNVTLWLFPYDWRLNQAAQFGALNTLIQTAVSVSGVQSVILLSHSTGGLISTAYVLSDEPEVSHVKELITMGTPFWGTPKAYYGILYGYNFGNSFVGSAQEQCELQEAALNSFDAYELMPRAPFLFWSGTLSTIAPVPSGAVASLDQAYSVYFGRERCSIVNNNNGVLNPTILSGAESYWSATGTMASPTILPVPLYSIIGYGISTLGQIAIIPTTAFTSETIDGTNVVMAPFMMDGDGTDPLWSSSYYSTSSPMTNNYYVNLEQYCTQVIGNQHVCTYTHGNLADNPVVDSIISNIVMGNPPNTSSYPYQNVGIQSGCASNLILAYTLATGDTCGDHFQMHSNAILNISEADGASIGGYMTEGINGGSFFSFDGSSYITLPDLGDSYSVQVNGTGSGEFTLEDTLVPEQGIAQSFSYFQVPVSNGTVATLSLQASQIAKNKFPALSAKTNGTTTTYKARFNPIFVETGLPLGTEWQLTFDGTTFSSNTSGIFPNSTAGAGFTKGEYSWEVDTPVDLSSNTRYAANPDAGTMTIPTNVSETINFVPQYNVTFAVSPYGGGSTNPSGWNWYSNGTVLEINASSSSGYVFQAWSSSNSTLIISKTTQADATVTIQGSGTITAKFKKS